MFSVCGVWCVVCVVMGGGVYGGDDRFIPVAQSTLLARLAAEVAVSAADRTTWMQVRIYPSSALFDTWRGRLAR